MNRTIARITSAVFSVAAATVVITGSATVGSIAAGTVPAAFAQDQAGAAGPPPGVRGGRMGKILMQLNLSDAQKTQVRAIIADARKQNKDVTDRDVRRTNMKAAYAKVDTVLTPAQRTELHAKMDAMREQSQTPRPQ